MGAMGDRGLRVTQGAGGVVTFAIDRPAARNAVDRDAIEALAEAFVRLETDEAVRAIILTGSGENDFCTGLDLPDDAAGRAATASAYIALLRAIRASPHPVVARVNGRCFAAGMGLLGACDLAVACAEARFGLPEVRIGLFPVVAATMLRRLVPERHLMELMLSGRSISAEEGRRIGLLNHVVPGGALDEKLSWLLGQITEHAGPAMRTGKQAIEDARTAPLGEALTLAERQLLAML